MAEAARKKVMANLNSWQKSLHEIDYIVVSCSSCGFALMKDWGCLIPDAALAETISAKTIHISHLLNQVRDRLAFKDVSLSVAYHQPCHLRIQPQSDSSKALLAAIPGVDLRDLNSACCGMAGSWGLMAKNYALSRSIGTPMAERLNDSGADFGVTDCPTCQMQMEHLGNPPVRHPVEIVAAALLNP
jgi:Fe-S oxidoreductase